MFYHDSVTFIWKVRNLFDVLEALPILNIIYVTKFVQLGDAIDCGETSSSKEQCI